ncbi:MAG: ribonuclease P protein component [Candidatus Pacebacteria bacterium]|nr:ribonuclease P protein component [Candidatus Paceibacterota bacterium]
MLKKKYKFSVESFKKAFPLKIVKKNHLSLKITPNNKDFSRFNLIISSKYDKRSVYRNKLKRAIFEWIRLNLPSFSKGKDVLIIINSSSKSADIQNFIDNLKTAFESIK